MKNLVLFFFLLLPYCLLSQGDTLNITDSKGRKQGTWTKKYENGKTRYIGQFKDDKPIGTFKYYDNYGTLTSEVTHLGKDTSLAIFYHGGVSKMSEGKYYKTERTGIWKFYDGDGDITSQCIYQQGKKQGPARVYYKDGRIAREENYRNGILHGSLEEYFKNGRIKLRATYVDGNYDGKIEYFYGNGAKKIIGNYQFAVREKMWTFYDKQGHIEYYEFYKEGFLKWRKTPAQLKEQQELKKQQQDSLNLKPKVEK